MSNPTPGPWVYEYGAIYSPAVGRIGLADRDNPLTKPWERDCNARLMAAAPDLLAALEFVREFYQRSFDVMPVAFQSVDDLCAQAIARATGGRA